MTRRAPTFTTAQVSRAARGAMKAGAFRFTSRN
jgi:hypothetical protein